MDDKKTTELTKAMAPEAVSTNRFFLMANAERLRITFGEMGPDGVIYRSAISLSRANAMALGESIQKLLLSDPTPQSTIASEGGALH